MVCRSGLPLLPKGGDEGVCHQERTEHIFIVRHCELKGLPLGFVKAGDKAVSAMALFKVRCHISQVAN